MTHLYEVLPIIALVLALVALVSTIYRPLRSWVLPAVVSVVFFGWTAYTVAVEGVFTVWPNHTQNAWGNQVWFDLLIALSIGWALILPRARAVGMHPWPWLIFICLSGCIGLTAMVSRCLFLEEKQSASIG